MPSLESSRRRISARTCQNTKPRPWHKLRRISVAKDSADKRYFLQILPSAYPWPSLRFKVPIPGSNCHASNYLGIAGSSSQEFLSKALSEALPNLRSTQLPPTRPSHPAWHELKTRLLILFCSSGTWGKRYAPHVKFTPLLKWAREVVARGPMGVWRLQRHLSCYYLWSGYLYPRFLVPT